MEAPEAVFEAVLMAVWCAVLVVPPVAVFRRPRSRAAVAVLLALQSAFSAAQTAYVVKATGEEEEIEFALEVDPDYYGMAQKLINPAIVVEGWGRDDADLSIHGKNVPRGESFRIGHEQRGDRTDMVLWLKLESNKGRLFTIRRKRS